MQIVFCSEPFSPLRVDSAYESEADAAQAAGFNFDLVDFEAWINAEDLIAAIRKVKKQPAPVVAIYRGWMLKPEEYVWLYDYLAMRNINLINSPAQYKHCHNLAESFSLIEKHTPATIFVKLMPSYACDAVKPHFFVNFYDVFRQLSVFGDKPLILKDYVKSRNYEWNQACFIPSASDRAAVERIVNRFLKLQGDDLDEWLVIREFIEFQPLAAHSKSEMPLTKEFRLFFLDGELIDSFEYLDEGDYSGSHPPDNIFADVARSVQSRFFTMDIAQTVGGEWQIIKLGDGQVAGLPDNADITRFYQALKSRL